MLAIIDGLSNKLTALGELVQGLVNNPASTVPYSAVGDVYVGVQTPPNPEPRYAYRCEDITNGLTYSAWPLSQAEFNKIKPWRAKKSWTTAPIDFGWAHPLDNNIDQLRIYSIGRRGTVVVNNSTHRLYSSEDGHVKWKELPFPDQDKCEIILNFIGLYSEDAAYMLAVFKIDDVSTPKVMYVEWDRDTKAFVWKTVANVRDLNPMPSGQGGGIIDFDVDKSSNVWALLYQPDNVNKDVYLVEGYKYDQPSDFKNFNLGSVETYTTARIGYGGSFVLLTKSTGFDVYAHSSNTIAITYLNSELGDALLPKTFDLNYKPEYAYDNGAGWFYINSTADAICYLSGTTKKSEVYLTKETWLEHTNLDKNTNGVGFYEVLGFTDYIVNSNTQTKLIGVECDASSVLGGTSLTGTFYFNGFDWTGSGQPAWVPISPVVNSISGKPAINNNTAEVYFMHCQYGSYDYKVNLWLSQCLNNTKNISVPPIPGGWCITGKYKIPDDVEV